MNELITIKPHEENKSIAIFHMHDHKENNSFHDEFVEEIILKLDSLQDNDNYKVVILKGLPDIFSSGASKGALMKLFGGNLSVKDLVLSELLLQIPVPVIAAMEGGAVGGGFVVGLCADIIIMAERSMYGGGFTDLGFSPGMGYTRLIQWLVGDFIANEMLYTGRMYKGKYYKDRSMVNYVVPKDKVMDKALYLADIISDKPIGTLKTLKYSVSLKKRQLLLEARVHEDFMHKITFNQPEVKNIIETMYTKYKKD